MQMLLEEVLAREYGKQCAAKGVVLLILPTS